ncbi:MAG: ABC transporter permease [Spirochaetales bacterium]|nr:ABC transporter permease [Spirochaetales bacterium]
MKKQKGQSEFSRFVYQLSKNKMAMIGLVILIIEIFIAIFANQIAPYGYQEIDPTALRQAPSAKHWFGTDEIGRDIFSRVVVGTRYSLSMGILATAISSVIGIVIGAIAGFAGGWTDNIIMRALDVIQSLPGMLLTIVMSAVLGSGYFNTILALSVGAIPGQARMLRANMLKQRKAEYIEAAYSINCSPARIIFKHLVPNSISANIVGMTMGVAHTIIQAASLSFIGLGIQPPTPDWGAMLSGARAFIRKSPHMVIFPGLAIAITVLAVNMLGDGIRDAMDPKLKK